MHTLDVFNLIIPSSQKLELIHVHDDCETNKSKIIHRHARGSEARAGQ